MANEVTVRTYVRIKYGNLVYSPPQRQYQADLSSAFGPTPGALTATYDGTDVDVSKLVDPGWMEIINQEPTIANGGVTVSWGIYDSDNDQYYPIGKLAPGQSTGLLQLDDLFGGEFYPATGTGSSGNANRLRIKAKDGDTASVVVNVFDR